MAQERPHTPGQTYLAVTAVRKLLAGEPIAPKSCTRGHFGKYYELIEGMRTAYQEAVAGEHSDASVKVAMEAYWAGVRQGKDYREIVEAVGAMDLAEAATHVGPDTPTEGTDTPLPFRPYSLADLQHEDLPERHWIIDGVLPEGVHLIAGPSGGGKSYWAFQLCLGVAHGRKVFSKFDVEQGEALYLSLEDDKLGMRERAEWLEEDGSPWPRDLYITHEARRLDTGLVDDLRGWLREHPKTRVIVIDVLFNIRVPTRSKEDLYAQDYAVAQALKPLAQEYHVAIVLLHHSNKRPKPDDPLDTVSGSTGLIAPADVKGVFLRASGEADWTLYLRGRPIPEQRLSFTFRECVWTYLGEAQAVERSTTQKAILQALQSATGPMMPKTLSERTGIRGDLVRFTLRRMLEDGTVKQPSRGWYVRPTQDHLQHSQQPHTSQLSHTHSDPVVSPSLRIGSGRESPNSQLNHMSTGEKTFVVSPVSPVDTPPLTTPGSYVCECGTVVHPTHKQCFECKRPREETAGHRVDGLARRCERCGEQNWQVMPDGEVVCWTCSKGVYQGANITRLQDIGANPT
jgi:hypothetical protein